VIKKINIVHDEKTHSLISLINNAHWLEKSHHASYISKVKISKKKNQILKQF